MVDGDVGDDCEVDVDGDELLGSGSVERVGVGEVDVLEGAVLLEAGLDGLDEVGDCDGLVGADADVVGDDVPAGLKATTCMTH